MRFKRLAPVLACLLVAIPAAAAKHRFLLRGSEPGAQFGEAVDGVGDLNRDGRADFIVGEPMSDGETGRAIVYSGRNRAVLYEYAGPAPASRFGYSAAGLGDVSGDGLPDFVVGAPLEAEGRAYVYSGADGHLIYALEGAKEGAKFGAAVAAAGDVDRDGLADVIVTAPGTGTVEIFSGADGSRLRRHKGFQGIQRGIRCTNCVHSGGGDIRLIARNAGDVNGDGFLDLVVGDTWADEALGHVFLFSGKDGGRMKKWVGRRSGSSYFGFSVDSIEDLDGDGFREILIGINGTWAGGFYGGEVQIVSGRTGNQLRRHLPPTNGHSYMGRPVRSVSDLDGDGVEDYYVGLPYRKRPDFLRGQVWLYSGATGRRLAVVKGARRKSVTGWQPRFGYYLNPAGDVTGDGLPDLVVSSPGERSDQGAVRIYSGKKVVR